MGKAQILCGQKFNRWSVGPRGPNSERARQWVCKCDCGNYGLVGSYELVNGNSKSCGCWRRDRLKNLCGPNSPLWKGGRSVTKHGYMEIYDPEYPNVSSRKRVLEHKKVMSDHLGRMLRPEETVHHKNGIRHDNRLENLELWVSDHPPGQRVEDLVTWAKEILALYG